MMNAMYGKKIGMSQVFTEGGEFLPVTAILLPPNVVFQVKSLEKDGYRAVQVGIGSQKIQRVNKPLKGHIAKAEKGSPETLKELRQDSYFSDKEFGVGDEIKMEGLFDKGTKIDIVGTSIGKGFAGVIKRHGMKGAQTQTHGTHEYFRHAGSIGCRKFPGRVFKNKRMPGHMGSERVMVQGIEVVDVLPEKNILLVKGGIPGPKNGTVLVRTAIKA
ncbi:MAG TPA: 50S ribosomal protein L3 [Oligoflexia bacterium]|nr:50S ribosomal protein L3 [Oligoflexia bacterium]HMP49205.1 50S ribosomal protein L3 [Oligoflexia bacterium]